MYQRKLLTRNERRGSARRGDSKGISEFTSHFPDFIVASEILALFIDSEFRIVWFTPNLPELFDFIPPERGGQAFEVGRELDYQPLREDAEAVLATRVPIERETNRDNGCWYLMRARAYGTEGTSTHGVIFTFIDITHRKEAEEALRMSEQRFRALVAASSDALFTVGPSGEELRQLKGGSFLADTTSPTTSWVDFYIPQEDQPALLAAVRESVRTKSVFELEHRVRRADGTIGWTISRAVPVRNSDGEVIEWFGAGNDITERKLGEEAGTWLSAIIQTSPDGIISKSLDGVITSWNPGAERIFGYTEAEAVGQPITMIIPPDRREEGRQILARLQSGEVIEKLETVRLRKDGSPVQVSLTICPLAQCTLKRSKSVDVQAAPRAVEFVEDITRAKQVETALRTSEKQLRALAGSLLTAQEDERRRIARDLHDDVTQALALIAIDLGKLAVNDGELENIGTALRMLQARVNEVSRVVRHVSHGLHPSMLEDFGLAAALEAFCDEFSNVEGIPVDFHADADEERLTASAAAGLYRVAQEAIRNARKHSRASHLGVELTNDGDRIRLSIRDDGVGIERSLGGRRESGLGLVSMKERIRLLHGELLVRSTPGHGTDVIASVPVGLVNGDDGEDSARR